MIHRLFGLGPAFWFLRIKAITMITVAATAMIRAINTVAETTPLMMATVLSEFADGTASINGPTGAACKIGML